MKYYVRLLLVLTFLVSMTHAKEFIIDNTHTTVGFNVTHMMISNVKGKFNIYSGDIEFDPATKQFSKLTAKIEASSVDTGIVKRDDHLRSADFFDAAKYKTIDFVMSSMKDGKVYGKLSIHGITKDVVLDVKIHGVIKDFQGHQRVGFTLEGVINRKDFGLTWNKILEGGGLTVSEDVKLAIDVEAIEL
ncbi:MAG: YceI family protein [Sulfurospirillaceae bacterium]|nr:YceI family protein [Sulfurospirillaceae bacterium]MDD2826412.1 YceI family protein [Sulfurospirillaceae bacterium]